MCVSVVAAIVVVVGHTNTLRCMRPVATLSDKDALISNIQTVIERARISNENNNNKKIEKTMRIIEGNIHKCQTRADNTHTTDI